MSTQKSIGFGRIFFGFGSAIALAGAAGCASPGELGHGGDRGAPGVAMAQGAAAVRVGDARVIDAHVNPLAPVRLTAEEGGLVVRFTRGRQGGALVHLDGASLAPVGPESWRPAERMSGASSEPARLPLGDGRFIVCWKSGDVEHGYRVMVQEWSGGGSRIGAPAPISPPDADVLGVPQLVSLDGVRAVATFAAVLGDRTELFAVPLETL